MNELICGDCSSSYHTTESPGQWDLKLRRPKVHKIIYDPAARSKPSLTALQEDLPPNPDSVIPNWRDLDPDWQMRYGNGLTPELISYFPKPESGSGWMLDFGCGRRNYASLCQEVTGLQYIGVDYGGAEPDLLVDAHSLPFADDSFDFIISMAVLEHLSHPYIAMSEAFRTLKPGAVFVGTVAFLETFHLDSHFHMTHLGTNRVLRQAGFELLALAPNRAWTGLRAQAEMALFPGLPPIIQRTLVGPSELISKLLWALKRRVKRLPDLDHLVQTTGGFRFVARKPAEAAANLSLC